MRDKSIIILLFLHSYATKVTIVLVVFWQICQSHQICGIKLNYEGLNSVRLHHKRAG